MTILAFDTCFGACSAAVWRGEAHGQPVELHETMEKGHSERLVPMIAEALRLADVKLRDITTIVTTLGPGSFTGVRTAVAVARALALPNATAVRGATSLHAMAMTARDSGTDEALPIAATVLTRDGLVFFQQFFADTASPVGVPVLITLAEAASWLAGSPHGLVGSGATALCALHPGLHRIVDPRITIHSRSLARRWNTLAIQAPPLPLYLREPDAKPQIDLPHQTETS